MPRGSPCGCRGFRVSQALNDAARNLAANLLRVIAGAGKKHALIDEATALLKACRELQPYSGTDAYSYSPIAAIAEGLTDLDWRKNNPAEDFRRGIAGDAKFRPTIAELSRLTRMRALRFAEEAAQIGRVLTAKTRKRIDPAERAPSRPGWIRLRLSLALRWRPTSTPLSRRTRPSRDKRAGAPRSPASLISRKGAHARRRAAYRRGPKTGRKLRRNEQRR